MASRLPSCAGLDDSSRDPLQRSLGFAACLVLGGSDAGDPASVQGRQKALKSSMILSLTAAAITSLEERGEVHSPGAADDSLTDVHTRPSEELSARCGPPQVVQRLTAGWSGSAGIPIFRF